MTAVTSASVSEAADVTGNTVGSSNSGNEIVRLDGADLVGRDKEVAASSYATSS